MSTVFIGRQPILDRERRTFAYELLYRNGTGNAALIDDADAATRAVVEGALLDWGFNRIVGSQSGFINTSATALEQGLYRALPATRVVLELLEDVQFDETTKDAMRAARSAGYRLALDDLVAAGQVDDEVLSMVDFLKVDLVAVAPDDLGRLTAHLRDRAPTARLVAEKVEEHCDFQRCLDLGYDLFQGYFFARPEVLERSCRLVHHGAALALMAEAQRPGIEIDQLERSVIRDPTIAFRLLSMVNSSAVGLRQRVASVRHAIVLLGVEPVRQFATLLAMSAGSNTNHELVLLAATRSRLAALLVDDRATRDVAVTTALLSVVDVAFGIPMRELLADLPIDAAVADALIDGSGPMGDLLALIRSCERADVAALELARPGQLEQLHQAFGSATAWADALRVQLAVA
ncbi:MAG: EAL and HDOD domain-containing protein [Acidimicrobiia bacterium]